MTNLAGFISKLHHIQNTARLERLTLAVRGTDVSQHKGDPMKILTLKNTYWYAIKMLFLGRFGGQ